MNTIVNKSSRTATSSYCSVQDPVAYFIEHKRDKIWKKNQSEWKNCFRLQLRTLKLYIDNNASDRLMNSFMYRLGLGYWGIGKQNGISSGICSLDAVSRAGVKKTDDHLIGAQCIGKTIHAAFESCGFDEEYMVNEYLYENLWMFMTIRVTQDEHKSCNISKTITEIEEKRILRHYINVSPLVTLNK